MNLMYASNSLTIICCHVLNFILRHSVLVAVIHDVVKSEREEKDVLHGSKNVYTWTCMLLERLQG